MRVPKIENILCQLVLLSPKDRTVSIKSRFLSGLY